MGTLALTALGICEKIRTIHNARRNPLQIRAALLLTRASLFAQAPLKASAAGRHPGPTEALLHLALDPQLKARPFVLLYAYLFLRLFLICLSLFDCTWPFVCAQVLYPSL